MEFYYCKGDYEAALVEYKKALAIAEASLGKDHPDTATTYKNIGSVLYRKGDYEAALVEYKKALAIQEASLGKGHHKTAATIGNIGNVLSYKGDYEAALVKYEKALATAEASLGKDSFLFEQCDFFRSIHPVLYTLHNTVLRTLHVQCVRTCTYGM